MRILVTGASGNLGRKLRGHFGADRRMELRALCLNPDGDPAVRTADLADDGDWASDFEGVDTVIHLAGDPRPSADWASIERANIRATLNVLEAARLHKVKRLVFASSSWVMAGYRFSSEMLTTDLAPRPINAYGASKLFGEQAGMALWRAAGISFIALRIGYCQRAEGNTPGPHMGYGLWGQQMWLSDRDLCQGFDLAVRAPDVGGAVLNLMSANEGMRWDLTQTRSVIGYVPEDRSQPVETDETRRADAWARSGLETLGGLTALLSSRG